jgi:carboxypeptidase T
LPPAGDGPWVVRAFFSSRQMVHDLAAWKEPWEVHYDEGYLVVDVTPGEYERLLQAGFVLTIDAELTTQLNRPLARLPGQATGIPGYPCYRTVEETFAAAQGLVADYPNLAAWQDVGDSWEKTEPGGLDGYDMMVLRLTNSSLPGPKPKLFVTASIHAREYAPAELVTRLGEYLVQRYGSDPDVTWVLDYHEIHLMLQANPDGRKQAEAKRELLWRKNTDNNYCSNTDDRGADLNRNFEFQWGCCGGSSGNECSELYRGPAPASEPEVQAVQNYLRSQFPDQRAGELTAPAPVTTTGIYLDFHSYGELVLWPWGFTSEVPPNGTALQTLGRKLAFFSDYSPEQAIGLYPTDGTTDDFAYGDLGLAAYTVEVGNSFFQSCSLFEDTIVPDNLAALIYAAKVVCSPYLTPAGPDTLAVALSPALIIPGDTISLTATFDDTRYQNRNGVEPTQNIVAAEYTIDIPPWVTATVPIAYPMAALDGALDSPVEGATATVDTAGLSVGRHLLFVHGQDADGNWGPVSAAFLDLVSPSAYLPLICRGE